MTTRISSTDYITPTDKKALIYMINNGMNTGQKRNKIYNIKPLTDNTAQVTIGTITHSIILGRKEVTTQKVEIKHK